MRNITFDEVWGRIINKQGQLFYTVTGLEFKFIVEGEYIITTRTTFRLHKKEFEKAFKYVPISGPSYISKFVRGPAYVWAILHDKRISQGEW